MKNIQINANSNPKRGAIGRGRDPLAAISDAAGSKYGSHGVALGDLDGQ